MKKMESIDEFIDAAMDLGPGEHPGNLFVCQTAENEEQADEVILSDEDTVRSNVMQLYEVLLETEQGSLYFRYPFVEPLEMEEIQEKLEPLFEHYPQVVLKEQEMNERVTSSQ